MRMHKKCHMEERLFSCGDIVTTADLSDKNMLSAVEKKEYLNFEKIFSNDNKIHLEIGCGKGKFVCELAKLNYDINYIAVEKISNVLLDACERAKKENIKNIHFLNCAAEVLTKYLPIDSVDVIYLNFSNPLPKEGYKKQRLTHPRFLESYKKFLKPNGKIIQKTDSKDFYIFSLESFISCGFVIEEKCEDLAAYPISGDIETEHEKLFLSQGKKIHRIVARLPHIE